MVAMGYLTRTFPLFAALSATIMLAPMHASADQNDPVLDGLFKQLQAAPNVHAGQALDREIWQAWLRHEDDRTESLLTLGASAMNRGRIDVAMGAFNEAIKRHPDFAEAWNKRATLKFFTGDLEGSVADCAQVLKLEPRHYGALSGLGMIYITLEDWGGAIRWIEAALAINPHMPGARAALAEARKKFAAEET
ncbi:MAG: tetratricopeptide repeat protein [Alphaproteobacteria bacterium]|nr:tetratricopeptide repeat protein [Alphaproteobacteria bacterium]